MDKRKFYKALATTAVLVGVGMVLGHNLSNGTTNNGLWVGGILVLLGAVTFGMSLGVNKPTSNGQNSDHANNQHKQE